MLMGYIEVPDCFSTYSIEAFSVPTVFNCEHRSERTICLSGQVVMYVSALTPLIGTISVFDQCPEVSCYSLNIRAGMYSDLLDMVSSSLRTSDRLFSISLLDCMGALQPTPFCQIAYVTFFLDLSTRGMVKPV